MITVDDRVRPIDMRVVDASDYTRDLTYERLSAIIAQLEKIKSGQEK